MDRKIEYHKALIWKDPNDSGYPYAFIENLDESGKKEFAESAAPQLIRIAANIKDMKDLYPELDFTKVKMMIIRSEVIREDDN